MTMTIFDTEENIIKKVQALLNDEQYQDNPLRPDLGDLLKHYQRVYKQLRHVISLSDRQQLRLNELNRQLSDSNASKDKFFSIIAHDLRGPLSSLIGLSEVLQEQVKIEAPKTTLGHSVELIYSSTKDLYTLLENLLTWSQIQRGSINYKPEELNLAEICKFALRLFHSRAQQKHLQLLNAVPQNIMVEADYNMLSTVLRNLLSNAVKFTPSGGRITISATRLESSAIEVSVSDTGIGIPKEDLDKLFRLDQGYSEIGTAGEKGTGLGLNLCKEFIEKAGQTIWVESEVGQGTSFQFTLFPFLRDHAGDVEPSPAAASERSVRDFSQYRMLVVDDVPANRQALIDFLRPLGFRFREAGNGREALTIWKHWQPQMVWMDIRMPVMDGYAGARQIREFDIKQNTAIIALTASIPEEEYPNVLAAGYDSLIRKPFEKAEVLEIIEEHLPLRLDSLIQTKEEETVQQNGPLQTRELRPEDLAELSPGLLERLDYVAKVFDMSMAYELLEELRPQHKGLAEGLEKLLAHFSFDKLQELLVRFRAL